MHSQHKILEFNNFSDVWYVIKLIVTWILFSIWKSSLLCFFLLATLRNILFQRTYEETNFAWSWIVWIITDMIRWKLMVTWWVPDALSIEKRNIRGLLNHGCNKLFKKNPCDISRKEWSHWQICEWTSWIQEYRRKMVTLILFMNVS